MGQRSCNGVALFFLILVLVLVLAAAAAGSVRCQEVAVQHRSNQETYEIDYRGPETHSSLPPPQSLRGTKAKPSRRGDMGSHRKVTHG